MATVGVKELKFWVQSRWSDYCQTQAAC